MFIFSPAFFLPVRDKVFFFAFILFGLIASSLSFSITLIVDPDGEWNYCLSSWPKRVRDGV